MKDPRGGYEFELRDEMWSHSRYAILISGQVIANKRKDKVTNYVVMRVILKLLLLCETNFCINVA